MSGTSFLKFWAPGLVALGAMLSTCAVAPTDPPHTEQKLQGTWLREYAMHGMKARRILTLELDGSFRERVRVVDQAGAITDYDHDDVARIVGLAQASSGLNAESAAAMAVGLKLLAETVLEHKDNPLFDGMRQPLRDFIKELKSRTAHASQ